ncbi:hypothetical protein DT73_13110 [Mangrovibacter sp. MFB070]|uniref:hypothetical protein n=1 Tax=Mangrovibacter sp. MFB070 TaxID=1224318 RepID=UPI0004DAE324|nr:hypothetical protein [Mangrovibacter sp. MFB070]KEA51867.1 hypothetical protein DT73_13110 [Mangrovibacter sp. MFB070]
MSRAFTKQQVTALLDYFGETISINGSTDITVIFEQEQIVIDGTDGLIQTEQMYFSTKQGIVNLEDTFTYNYKNYQIYDISDDLSGIVNVYYREI